MKHVLLLLLASGTAAPSGLPAQARPDIVFILTDDQAFHTLWAMPAVDTLLVRRGVRFVNYTVTTPVCAPSRATELTGQHTHRHMVYDVGPPIGSPGNGALAFQDSSTLAIWLQRAGYRTGQFGKYINAYDRKKPWPYVPPGWSDWRAFKNPGYFGYRLVENGVEVFYGDGDANYSTDVIAAKAVDFIRATPAAQPLYLHFAPYAPHHSARFPTRDKGLFTGVRWRSPNYAEPDVSDKPAWVRGLTWTSTLQGDFDKLYVNQLRSLQAVDRAVVRIVQTLAETGRLDNAVIVLASDNGFSLGAHRHGEKRCVYEECVRTPFVVRAPGVLPRDEPALVQNLDLAPTLADFAGATPTIPQDGASFKPLLYAPSTPWRQTSLLEMLIRDEVHDNPVEPYAAVRTSRYTYVELPTGETELYDRDADPHQLQNVTAQSSYAAVRASLEAELDRLHTNASPTAAFSVSCPSLTCTFTDASRDVDGTVYGWQWDFGDGTTSTLPSPTHTYAAPGTYTVTLLVRDNRQATASAARNVVASGGGSQSPFGGAPRPLPGTVQFEDFDEGGEGVAYHDADTQNLGGQYRSTGVDVGAIPGGGWLVGWTKAGEWLEYTVNVASSGTHRLEARVASAGVGGTLAFVFPGDTLTLSVPNTGGWQTYVTLSGDVVLQAGPQLLRVAMPAQGPSGGVGNLDAFTLRAEGPPNAAPTSSFTSSCPDLTCAFTDTSTDPDGSVVSWSWSFGDGATSSLRHPSHTYASPGSFTVTLATTDDDGAMGSTSRTVTVQAGQGPFGGAPHALPGVVQFEDFDEGGEGVAYHDVDAQNRGGLYRSTGVDVGAMPSGGLLVGWTKKNEWLEYTVQPAGAGVYVVEAVVASQGPGGQIALQAGAETLTFQIPDTGAWQTYTTLRGTLTLAAGTQVLRVAMPAQGPAGAVGNLDRLRFSPAASP